MHPVRVDDAPWISSRSCCKSVRDGPVLSALLLFLRLKGVAMIVYCRDINP